MPAYGSLRAVEPALTLSAVKTSCYPLFFTGAFQPGISYLFIMLNSIIAFAVRQKIIIGLLTLGLIGIGLYEATKLPIDAVPDITNNQVQVITVAPSFGASDIERLVTFPIELANSNINGIEEIRSFSRFGLSLVTIVFKDNVDVYWARQQVAERLQTVQSQIPSGIGTPVLGPITTGLGEIYQYVVRPAPGYEDRYDATALRTIQDWIIRRQLLGVKGVAEVSSFGGKLKQYEVSVDPGVLRSYGLSITDVFNTLEKNNQNIGGSYIEKGPTVLFIRSEGLAGSIADIEQMAITTTGGVPLRIRDVATVGTGSATRFGAMCYNNNGEVAGAVVMMLNGANSSEVIRLVKERMDLIRKNLPEGVVVEPFLDRTKMVNNAIATVETNLAEGALIVVFILVLFLGNLRAGLIVASVIPLAMLFAIVMMNLFGVSGNLMSLGALDFGLIVDGAVIVVEAVMHQLTHSRQFVTVTQITQTEMDNQVKKAAGRMMNSAVFGQIIILMVYLPIFALRGIEGKMFRPMAQTVSFALIGAFLLSLTYIPMMSAVFLSKKIHHQPNWSERTMMQLEKWYDRALQWALRFKRSILTIAVLVFAASLYTFYSLGGVFIPELEEGDFAVDTRVLTGSNINTTITYTQQAAGLLMERFPEVEKVVTKIGSGEVPTDPMPMEASDMMVILKDKSEWTSAKSFPELAEKMSHALQDVPGITTGFQYPVQMRFNELMTGARQDVVIKIFGENLDSLATYAARLGSLVKTVQGAEDLYVETVTGVPQVVVNYKRTLLAQYGLDIASINRIIQMAFAGTSAGMVFEGERRFDLVVRLEGTKRQDVDNIRQLLIPLPAGGQIPLQQVATVTVADGPYQIQREDAKRRIVVGFNVSGRDVESIVEELQQKVTNQLNMQPGYFVTYGGAFENLNAARQRLMIAVPVSLLMIFILLFFAFQSVRYGLLIYTAIPLSAIGGIFLLALRGMPFSISAGIGFIALFGVAVLNGIVLIAEFKRLHQSGLEDLSAIVRQGGRIRLRPVLMTAMVASLGFLPMALSKGAGAEVQRPLATVVIGGLMVATFLTLFILPILYTIFESRNKKRNPMKTNAAILITLLAFGAGLQTNAQTISLKAALDSAKQNNGSLKQSRQQETYQAYLRKAQSGVPATNLNTEFGQVNSVYFDTRLGISQSFGLPGYYRSQRNYLDEEWKLSTIAVRMKETEIVRDVQAFYYRLLVLREQQHLLDSFFVLYTQLISRANQRLKAGETNLLEMNHWELLRGQLQQQQWLNSRQIEEAKLQMKWLLQTEAAYEPEPVPLLAALASSLTESAQANHPRQQYVEQQVAIAEKKLAAEKSRLLPTLELGYTNQSFRGIGADDKFYDAGKRFHAGQLTLGIPLFNSAQKARNKAAEAEIAVAQTGLEWFNTTWQTQIEVAANQYLTLKQSLQQIEGAQYSYAMQMQQTATSQLEAGEINYLEWALLNERSMQVRMARLETLQQLNDVIITLNYLQAQ